MTGWSRRGRAATRAMIVGPVLLVAGVARANPRPLPFTYQSETLPTGSVEIEQFIDFQPLRATATTGPNAGKDVWVLPSQFTTEFEVGVTDKLELGLYVTYAPTFGADYYMTPPPTAGNGAKQRARYRLADAGAWPVDVALYGELSESEHEIEVEAKVILQRRIGALRLITNLWVERELYLDGTREWVLDPTLGATVELSPRYHVGAEGWMRAEYADGGAARVFNQGPHVFVGPAFLASFGKLWWSTGVYGRVTDADRATQVGDSYGRVWFRTIIGLGF